MSTANDFVIENGVLKRYAGKGGDVVVPDGVVEIGNSVFEGWGAITTLTIPDSVQSMGWAALYGCSNLKRITMSVSTLKACAPWTGIFGGTGKTVELLLHRPGQDPLYTVGMFRKEYWSQSWNYNDDYIAPLTLEDIPNYDKLVAVGEFEGFKMNEQGRIKAMLLRLKDKERLVSEEYRGMFVDFLAGKFSKVIKFAEEDADASYVLAAAEAGAVNETNLKKVTNALKKSPIAEIQSLSDQLSAVVSKQQEPTQQETKASDVDKKYLDRLKKINAQAVLMKAGITSLPEILLMDGSSIAPAEYVQLIFAEYLSQYKKASYEFAPLADELACILDRNMLEKTVTEFYQNATTEKVQQTFLPLLFRYADGSTIATQYRSYKRIKWMEQKIDNCLLLSDTREAMMLADQYNLLGRYAQMRGTTEGDLQDTVLYDFGFDENGTKTYDIGGKLIQVLLNNDLTLCLMDVEKGKVIKSIPKKGADPECYNAAYADFTETKKNVKKAAKNKSNRLFREFLDGTETAAEKWKTTYFPNPLLRQIANLLIWEQAGKTFTLSGMMPIDANGQAYALTNDAVRLAHPMEMQPEDVEAWQKYFASHCLKQPFAQVWEPIVDPADIKTDRYKGCMIPYYRFLGQEKHGITVSDYNYHETIDIYLRDCNALIERIDWRRHEIDVNDNFEVTGFGFKTYSRQVNHIVTYLDRVTVYDRIRKDDITIEQFLPRFTLAQIAEFIKVASENNCTNVTAILLEYRQKNFSDYDPMVEFTLE